MVTSADQKLNEDVLCLIFLHNISHGSQHAHDSLDSTRMSSQVCRKWRDALLRFAGIWGRLLCFRNQNRPHAHGTSGEWFEEILRRSGTASLWITADINIECTNTSGEYLFRPLHVFFQALDNNWHRVERFAMQVAAPTSSDTHRTLNPWEFLLQPAPLLKNFSFDLDRGTMFLLAISLSPGKLFAGTAPQLEDFGSNGLYIYPETMNFGTTLRKYTLRRFMFPNPFAFTGLIALVRSSPLLEHIDVVSDVIEPVLPSLIQQHTVPSPRYIRLDTITILAAIILFNNIILDPDANVHISTSIPITDFSKVEVMDTIPSFFRRIIDHGVNATRTYPSHGPPRLLLSDLGTGVQFYGANSTVKNALRPSPPMNNIHISCTFLSSSQVINKLSVGIISSQLITMPMIRLSIDTKLRSLVLLRTLCEFSSLVQLITDDQSLQNYNSTYTSLYAERSSGIPMPHLAILTLITSAVDDLWMDELVHFLERRQHIGKPLTEVILVKDDSGVYNGQEPESYDLRPLERFPGLRVSLDDC